jgi:hypothetical protein
VGLAACNEVQTTTPTSGGEIAQATYTVELKTEGGNGLADITVYVYKDDTLTDLVAFAKTDKDGKVTIKLPDSGSYVISAVSSTQTLVPPVCKVNVAANPDAGDSSLYIMMAAMVFIFAATTIVAGKKVYEK